MKLNFTIAALIGVTTAQQGLANLQKAVQILDKNTALPK